MPKGSGKKIGIGVAVAAGATLLLLLLAALLVLNGVLSQEQIPMWLLRSAGPILAVVSVTAKKPRKHKRKKRR